MTARVLALLAGCVLAPFAPAADNPYRAAQEGDYATYKMKVRIGNLELEGTTTQTVVAKTDKEATVKITAVVGGMEAPAQEQKIDLTKPYDPTKVSGQLPPGTEASVEKTQDGKEKVKVAGKDYEATWTSYTLKAKSQGVELEGVAKVWMSRDVPLGLLKMESTLSVMKMEMKMTLELSETGNKKKK